jgi:hypothetical protein
MENTQALHFIAYISKKKLNKIRQKFCFHHWAYSKSTFLIGRRYAQYECAKCHKIAHMRYDYDCESHAAGI